MQYNSNNELFAGYTYRAVATSGTRRHLPPHSQTLWKNCIAKQELQLSEF